MSEIDHVVEMIDIISSNQFVFSMYRHYLSMIEYDLMIAHRAPGLKQTNMTSDIFQFFIPHIKIFP